MSLHMFALILTALQGCNVTGTRSVTPNPCKFQAAAPLCTVDVLANSARRGCNAFCSESAQGHSLAFQFGAALHSFAHEQKFCTHLRNRVVFARAMLSQFYSQFQEKKQGGSISENSKALIKL